MSKPSDSYDATSDEIVVDDETAEMLDKFATGSPDAPELFNRMGGIESFRQFLTETQYKGNINELVQGVQSELNQMLRNQKSQEESAKSRSRSAKSRHKRVSTGRDKVRVERPPSKTEIYSEIAEVAGVSKRDMSAVFDSFMNIAARSLTHPGSNTFVIPGLAKIVVQHKPATKERIGVNPFTGEATVFKAKPARNIVKIRPLKKLKDMVG